MYGTGMGLKRSGDMADAAFFTLAEAPVLDPVFLATCGIDGYFR